MKTKNIVGTLIVTNIIAVLIILVVRIASKKPQDQSAESDLAYSRAIPNMVVLQPADWEEARQATHYLADHKGAAYLRLGRSNVAGL